MSFSKDSASYLSLNMEGPSLVILKEQVAAFKGKKVKHAEGNSKIDQDRLIEQEVTDFKSWGKHFLICFEKFTLRVHFLMFGSYRVNEKKDATPRLSLGFENGELNLYSCAIKFLEEDPDEIYDWSKDVMSDSWSPRKTQNRVRKKPDISVSDLLLDQEIFAGVGNIIKNEVLFRIRIHPESMTGVLTAKQRSLLVKEARTYSFDFYNWKKIYQLKKHWQVYNKRTCPRCKIPLIRRPTGSGQRRSFFCENCQKLVI
jgi:endonuclease VIII